MINSSWSILHTPQSPRSIKTTWGKKLRCVLINKRNLILLPTLVTFHSMSHCLQDVHITLGANKKSVLVCEDPFHTKRGIRKQEALDLTPYCVIFPSSTQKGKKKKATNVKHVSSHVRKAPIMHVSVIPDPLCFVWTLKLHPPMAMQVWQPRKNTETRCADFPAQ